MIIISPYARALRNEKENPKNYPYWEHLVTLLKYNCNEEIIQVGIEGEKQLVPNFQKNLSVAQLSELILECRTWVSVDSFFQHLCWDLGKPGIVLFGQSDSNIFGHPENTNLLKDRKYLREKQFWIWEQADYNPDAFVLPTEVLKHLV